jgi:hypothetical protein
MLQTRNVHVLEDITMTVLMKNVLSVAINAKLVPIRVFVSLVIRVGIEILRILNAHVQLDIMILEYQYALFANIVV